MYRSIASCCVVLAACKGGCGDGRIPSAPTLQNLTVTTAEDTPLSFTVPITAADASEVTLTVVTAPSHGTLAGAGPAWMYTPAADYNGSDTVMVRGEDQYGTATATVTIQVTAVDDAPVAHADSLAAGFETPLTVAPSTLLANDTDVDSDSATLTVTAVTAGSHGTVAITGGNVVFTPAIGYTGAATFSYTVSDGTKTGQGTVTVAIGVDEAPVAVDDTGTTNEDTALTIPDATLLANDTDAEHQTLAISAVGSPIHGIVTHTGSQVTFTPSANYHGAAGFNYTVTDGYKTDFGEVVVTVDSVNDVPVAVADTESTREDTLLIFGAVLLAANDTDVDGDTLTVTAVTATATSHGTAVLANGVVIYTPDANYNGPADFSYTVSDGNGGTADGTVSVTVNPVNDPPVAVDDAVSTSEDTPLVFAATQLAANDTDIENDTLTVTAVTPTATTHGTVTLVAVGLPGPAGLRSAPVRTASGGIPFGPAPPPPGSIVYTPAANFNGSADFDYTVSDGNGGTATGHVQVTVASVNDAPVVAVSPGSATYVENASATAVEPELAVSDVDSTNLTGATVQITAGCTDPEDVLAFTPGPGLAAGRAARAARAGSAVRRAAVVTPDPPGGIIVAGYDASTCTLTLTGTAPVAAYQAVLRQVTYANTSDDPSTTARTVTFTVDDGQVVNHTGSASRDLVVTAVNDPPVAVDDAVSTNEDTPLVFAATQLAANDTDAEHDTLTVTAVSATASTHGAVSLVPLGLPGPAGQGNSPPPGSIVYAPAADFNGSADFDYTVSDGHGGTATGHVQVTVASVNDAPVVTVSTGSVAYTENAAATAIDAGLAVGDVDSTDLTGATIQITAGCTDPEDVLAFTPGAGLAAGRAAGLAARAAANAPVVTPDPPGGIIVGAYDAATCTLTLTGTATVAAYQAVLRQVTYANTSDDPSTTARTVTFTIDDGQVANHSGSGSRDLVVTAVNDPPVAVDDAVSTNEDTPLVFAATQLAANDTDAEHDTLTVTAVSATASTHGAVSLVPLGLPGPAGLRSAAVRTASGSPVPFGPSPPPPGSIVYTPAADFNGSADFDYTVSDGHGGTATGHVQVTVASVNDAPVVTASTGSASYTENAAATPVDPGITVTDADSATLAGATIQITPGCTAAEDVLGLTLPGNGIAPAGARRPDIAPPPPPGNITVVGYAAASCTLTLSGTASVAEYQAALRQVTYANTSDEPSTTTRTVVFTVDDGQAASHTGSDSRDLAVTAVDDAPVAVIDSATMTEDDAATAIDVLANDTDVDAGAKSIGSVTQPSRGTVVITGGGTGLTYQPNANYCNAQPPLPLLAAIRAGFAGGPSFSGGPDTFTYTLSPGGSTATVAVTVTCVDDAPVAVDDADESVAEDSSGNTLAVLANDTDVDGGAKTIASVTQPEHGAAAIALDGLSVTYTPTAGYCNQVPNVPRDTFTYALTPGGSSATVSVTVTCACGKNKSTDFVVGSNN
jgi:hypothetical protein